MKRELDLSFDLFLEGAILEWICPEAEGGRPCCWVDALEFYLVLEKAAVTAVGAAPGRTRNSEWTS